MRHAGDRVVMTSLTTVTSLQFLVSPVRLLSISVDSGLYLSALGNFSDRTRM